MSLVHLAWGTRGDCLAGECHEGVMEKRSNAHNSRRNKNLGPRRTLNNLENQPSQALNPSRFEMFAMRALRVFSKQKQAAARILTIEHGVVRANRTILAVDDGVSTRLISSWSHAPKSALPAPQLSIDVDDRANSSRPGTPTAMIDFSDSSTAHSQKTTFELLRALAVFRVCQVKWIVDNAKMLLNVSNRINPTITEAIVERTFYKHFCAGRDSVEMKPVIDMLQRHGVRPILDYAAENEGGESDEGISPQDAEGAPRRVNLHGHLFDEDLTLSV